MLCLYLLCCCFNQVCVFCPFDVYAAQTEPLIAYYSKWAAEGGAGAPRYVKVQGIGSVEEIRDRIFNGLAG